VMMFHVGIGLQDSTRICGLEGWAFLAIGTTFV
jgi:hypothetical protein